MKTVQLASKLAFQLMLTTAKNKMNSRFSPQSKME